MKRGLECLDGCNGDIEFYRAAGDVECLGCGKLYRDHPHCRQSEYYDGSSQYPYHILHVLCNGDHVKL